MKKMYPGTISFISLLFCIAIILFLLYGCFELPTETLDEMERISRLDLKASMWSHGFPDDMVKRYVLDNSTYLNYPDAPQRLRGIIEEHSWLRLFPYHRDYQDCTKLAEDFLAVVNNEMTAAPVGLISHGQGFGHKELFLFYRKPGERLLTILLVDHRSMNVREFSVGLYIMKIENLRAISNSLTVEEVKGFMPLRNPLRWI